jgi:hypothetical protein
LVQLLHDYYAVQSLKPLKSDKQFSQYHDTQVTQKKFLFPLIFALKTLNKVAKVGVLQIIYGTKKCALWPVKMGRKHVKYEFWRHPSNHVSMDPSLKNIPKTEKP